MEIYFQVSMRIVTGPIPFPYSLIPTHNSQLRSHKTSH